MLNLPQGMGVGQGAEFVVLNTQWDDGKAAKAKSKGGATSQPPREASSTQQKSGET
jgi:hypothetical protein